MAMPASSVTTTPMGHADSALHRSPAYAPDAVREGAQIANAECRRISLKPDIGERPLHALLEHDDMRSDRSHV